jgi:hypothetical protein
MEAPMRRVALAVLLTGFAAAQNPGMPPRAAASDYPAHTDMKPAALAAAIVPPDKVRKMFSYDVASHYTVVEVAVYPGQSFDVDRFYFALKTGDSVSHAERPRDVAEPWHERKGPLGNGPQVTTETGVIYERSHDPVNGTRSGVSTWEGVGVGNGNPPPPPRSDPGALAQVEQRLQDRELPMGPTSKAVAGYLYFPQYGKKKKGDAVELDYSRDDDSASLKFPVK